MIALVSPATSSCFFFGFFTVYLMVLATTSGDHFLFVFPNCLLNDSLPLLLHHVNPSTPIYPPSTLSFSFPPKSLLLVSPSPIKTGSNPKGGASQQQKNNDNNKNSDNNNNNNK